MKSESELHYTSTRNACKLCSPLGACLAMRGIEGCIPLIHGSQGCATYIRRYGISHFREPIDIASSNFVEATAIFGGRENLFTAIDNVTRQYNPRAIGVTSTCLSETIGENVAMYLKEYEAERARGKHGGPSGPVIFYASTPSYRGSHMDGFHEAIWAAVGAIAGSESKTVSPSDPPSINVFSGFVSAEDLRELHVIMRAFDVGYTLLPDYSESLDGFSWEEYHKIPEGGTPISSIAAMNVAKASIYLGRAVNPERNAAKLLSDRFTVPLVSLDLPIGLEFTDKFFTVLEDLTGRPTPSAWCKARGRLIDAYIDGHKYCSSKRAIIYGEEDFVVAMSSFLDEIGIVPVIAATGAKSEKFAARMKEAQRNSGASTRIMDDADFETMLETVTPLKPDIVIGNSKGNYLARKLGIPMVRCGFPVHDRIGGHRILHLGYRGALNLFERICNAFMESSQAAVENGWTYI